MSPRDRLREFEQDRGLDAARASAFVYAREAAAERRAQLRVFRERRSQQLQHPAGPAGLAPVAGGPNWIPLGPAGVIDGQTATRAVVSGRVPGLAVSNDGRRVYAATANGGVWASEDSGRRWRSKSDLFDIDPQTNEVDSLACGAIALVDGGRADQDRLYVGTGEAHSNGDRYLGVGMLMSPDGGSSWLREDTVPAAGGLLGSGVYELAVDPLDPDNVIAATRAGLFRRSVAAGVGQWMRQAVPGVVGANGVGSVTAHEAGGTTTFHAAIHGGGVVVSTSTAGVHSAWTALPAPGFPTVNVGLISLAVSRGASPSLYALIANVATGHLLGVWRTDLGSTNWIQVTGVPADLFGPDLTKNGQGWYDQAIAVDPTNHDVFYVGGAGSGSGAFIHRCTVTPTVTGAVTAFPASSASIGMSAHPDVHALVVSPANHQTVWTGCDGGVFVAPNAATGSGNLFEARNSGLATMTLQGLAHHPSLTGYFFCGAQDNGGMRYTGDEVWENQQPGDGGDSVVNRATPTRLLNGYTNAGIRQFESDGDRWQTTSYATVSGETSRFYPPIVGFAPPPGAPVVAAQANRVAWAGQRLHLSDDFGTDGTWSAVPAGGAVFPGGALGQAIAFEAHGHIWVGLNNGNLLEYAFVPGPPASWTVTNHGRPVGGPYSITSIAPDRSVLAGTAVYVTLGLRFDASAPPGQPVWHFDAARPVATRWQQRSGAAPNALLAVHHNKIIVDETNPARLWVAADVGVWQSVDAGTTWAPMSNNLPDAAVLDLDLHPGPPMVLRAATHGRGAFEIPIGPVGGPPPAQPGVELTIRTNTMDTGRGTAPTAPVKDPRNRARNLGADQSPDICTDAPDAHGRLVADPATIDPIVMTRDLVPRDRTVLINTSTSSTAGAVTKVHVRVRNRGHVVADGVQVMLLVGRADATVGELPAGYAADVAAGNPIANPSWSTVGVRTIDGVGNGHTGIATFDLPSSILSAASLEAGNTVPLLALVSHPDDAYDAVATTPSLLCLGERRAAMVTASIRAATGAAATGVVNPPASSASGSGSGAPGPAAGDPVPRPSRLTAPATALLAHQRLVDAVDQISTKVNSRAVGASFGGFDRVSTPTRTERQVLALAKRAAAAFAGGPSVPTSTRHGAGTGTFAMLGAVCPEIAESVAMFEPGGTWVADAIRRGTPDLHRSLVAVKAGELALSVNANAKQGISELQTVEKIDAFTMGLLAATASSVLVNPQLADLLAKDTNLDWSPGRASRGAAAVDAAILDRVFGTRTRSDLGPWWPGVDDVPGSIWTGLRTTWESELGLPGGRKRGFGEFETGFDPTWITDVRLRNAYSLWRGDLSMGQMHWTGWWGWSSLFTMASPVALLICKALESGRSVFEPAVPFDERAAFDTLISGMGVGAIGPFVSSMALWSAIDEHTDPFVEALVLFLARAAITGVAWGTNGDTSQEASTRWLGMFAPMIGTDVYALIRSIVAGGNPPGDRIVFAMQTASSVNGLLTFAVGAAMHAIAEESDEEGFAWLTWALYTLLMLGVGIPIGLALASGGGWRRWFLMGGEAPSLAAALAAAGQDAPEAMALARAFDDSTLWIDPQTSPPADADLNHMAFPTGMRGLIRVWNESGDLEVSHDDDRIVVRIGAATTPVTIPYTGMTVAELLGAINGAGIPGLQAAAVRATNPDRGPDPDYRLPSPHTLADPGDRGPLQDHLVQRGLFVKVAKTSDAAYVIGHAPRVEHSTRLGLDGASDHGLDEFPVVPMATLGDLETSGLGAAADLTVLLALGAVPAIHGGSLNIPNAEWAASLGATGQRVDDIHQVFRRWNLAERRGNEWNLVVAGGARSEKRGSPAASDPLMRPYPGARTSPAPDGARFVEAMGWLPLWRAWLRGAGDPGVDGDADVAMPWTPIIRLDDGTRRALTNRELTLGVRFLLDLEA